MCNQIHIGLLLQQITCTTNRKEDFKCKQLNQKQHKCKQKLLEIQMSNYIIYIDNYTIFGGDYMQFNENLRKIRKKNGITQEQLAEKLNVSRQAVTKWESGKSLPNINSFKEIASIFDVTMEELL